MPILVTGHTGFAGRHLMRSGDDLIGLEDARGRIDLLEVSRLEGFLAGQTFDGVVHLAARTSVARSWKEPEATLKTNVMGTFYLLQALERSGFRGRLLYVSSGDVYGPVSPDELPLVETRWPKPINPYAVSKVSGEALCYQWSASGPFEVVVARPFNHIGPGQRKDFVTASFARQLVEVAVAHREPVLEVGNIDVTRDFTDVRDTVAAYRALLERGENGQVYNVASGVEHSLREVIDGFTALLGIDVEVRRVASRLRATETPRMVGSAEKLRQRTGWTPRIPFQQTLADILACWKELARSGLSTSTGAG